MTNLLHLIRILKLIGEKDSFLSWSTYELFMTDSLITNSYVKGAYLEMTNFLIIAW